MIRHHNTFRTGSAWGELPFTTQYTEWPAPQGSTSDGGQTSTTWEQANPSMAPDVFVPVSTGDDFIYDDEGEGSEEHVMQTETILGLTPMQWALVALGVFLVRS